MSELECKKGNKIWRVFVLFISTVIPHVVIIGLIWNNWDPIISLFSTETVPSTGTNGEEFSLILLLKMALAVVVIIAAIRFVWFFICGILGFFLNPIIMFLDRITLVRQVIVVVVFILTVLIGALFGSAIITIEENMIKMIYIACFGCLVVEGALLTKRGGFEEDSTYESGSHYEITFDSDGKGTAKEVTDYSGGGEYIYNTSKFLLGALAVLCGGIIVFVVKGVILVVKSIREYADY